MTRQTARGIGRDGAYFPAPGAPSQGQGRLELATGDELATGNQEMKAAAIHDDLLTERETSRMLKVASRTMEGWRRRGAGPPFIRLSLRAVRYKREDVEAWLAARTVTGLSRGTNRD